MLLHSKNAWLFFVWKPNNKIIWKALGWLAVSYLCFSPMEQKLRINSIPSQTHHLTANNVQSVIHRHFCCTSYLFIDCERAEYHSNQPQPYSDCRVCVPTFYLNSLHWKPITLCTHTNYANKFLFFHFSNNFKVQVRCSTHIEPRTEAFNWR